MLPAVAVKATFHRSEKIFHDLPIITYVLSLVYDIQQRHYITREVKFKVISIPQRLFNFSLNIFPFPVTMATADLIQNGTLQFQPPAEPIPDAVNPPATEETDSEEKKWPGWPGHCVFRLIVPVLKVGIIIGRKGELIKKTCEETRARIRVLDAPLGTPDRIVSIWYSLSLQIF